MYSEKRNVLQLLALLKAHSISRFVVSPGSRHIPIVISMESDSFFKLYSVVDERSASFFAIGLIQRFKEPVGVICTSGTASANYSSAINESLYQELPLLILTTDRAESLRDQHEDQMIRQSTMFVPITKMVANLPLVSNENDAWYNNRLINEALLELTHHGNGPVQINIPIPEHIDKFDTEVLPIERKITRYDLSNSNWEKIAEYLSGKKILIVCGEGYTLTEEQRLSIDVFCKKFNAIVLCDKMSNCHISNSIENAFPVLQALNRADISELAPNIIISIRANFSFNPEFKGFVKRIKSKALPIENWFIHPSGRIVDPYQGLLTNVYEMDEFLFFHSLSQTQYHIIEEKDYVDTWKIIASAIDEPNVPYGHIQAVGKFLKKIPNNSILQLSNSNSVRMAQLFHIDPSIEVHCNRGTDGIDGCMSTSVGYASGTNKIVFLMIGDLTFFYDMNALWNRHLGKNIRIFLDNNGGGAIMHMPKRPAFAAEHLPNFISAQHNTSAKAWAEDRGLIYLSVHSNEELDNAITIFTDINTEGPILLEVFSNMLKDTNIFKNYYSTINREKLDKTISGKSIRIIKKICNILGVDPQMIKKSLSNIIHP